MAALSIWTSFKQPLSIRAAVAKLHSVDDAFRQQLDAVRAAHQAELLQLAKEKQKQIDEAKQQVRSQKALRPVGDKRFSVGIPFNHDTSG